MRDRSKQLLVINTGKKESEQTRLPAQSGTTHIIGGGGLSVNMSDYLLKSIWDKVFEIRTDSQGTEYIFGKIPVVTQYGITMYSGDGVDVPSLASGLPFDGRTIWYNPETNQIEVIGGTGGGSGEGVSNFWDLSGIPSWITNSKPKYTYSEIEGTPDLTKYALASQIPSLSGYATESWVLGKSYITSAALGTELGKYVTLDTDQSLKGKKDFKNGLSIDGLEIRKSQDDVVYIDANLVVRGGVTMYAQNEVDIPSIIDSIPTASTTVKGIASFDGAYFSVVNGKVSLIASNVGLNEEELYNYLTSNNYAKKSDIPSIVGYATQSWVENKKYLTAITSAMVTSALGFTPYNSVNFTKSNIKSTLGISDWALASSKPSYTTSEVSEGTNLYFSNARAVSALTETLKAYVTLSGSQTITGEKNYTGGLKVNGSPIIYDSTKKYWKLEGDLLVTGGVTMYGNDSSFTPSTIMDAIAVDGITISKSGGVLKVIGGTGGGVADSVAWANITGKPNFASVATSGKYDDLIGKPTLLSSFTDDVVSGKYLPLSGGTLSDTLTISNYNVGLKLYRRGGTTPYIRFGADANNEYGEIGVYNDGRLVYWPLVSTQGGYGKWNTVWHSGNFNPSNYLPLSGGTLTNTLTITRSTYPHIVLNSTADNGDSCVRFDFNNVIKGFVGYSTIYGVYLQNIKTNKTLNLYDNGNLSYGGSTIWHEGNDGSGSGLDADLLDGVQESGFCRHFDGVHIESHRGIGYAYAGQGWIANGPALSIGYSGTNYLMQLQTPADYTALYFRNRMNGAWSSWKEIAFTDSNVASATKLQTARTIWGQSFDGTGNVDGDIYINGLNVLNTFSSELQIGAGTLTTHVTALYGTEIKLYSGGAKFYSLIFNSSGNVGIGTASPSAKLHVSGDILATGAMTFYSMRKLKNVVDERGLSLSELSTIKPTRYTWKDGRDNRLHFGGIADDIQQVLPEVVYKTSDGILTMDYGNAAFAVASSLIKPVVDHEKRIAMLQERIVELEEEVERLKSA